MAFNFAKPEIMMLATDDIEVGNRIGLCWPEKSQALGAMMAKDGQNEPIKVRAARAGAKKPWILVAGYHRLHGATIANIAHIAAIEVIGNSDKMILIEASENMHRRDFGPLEKSMFVRALADVYEAQFFDGHEGKSAQQIVQQKRWAADVKNNVAIGDDKKADFEADHIEETISAIYGWQDEAADAMGMTSRSLRDFLFIYRTVVTLAGTDETQGGRVHSLARHPLGAKRKSVMEIGKIVDPATRKAVIDLIADDRGCAIDSVADAKIKLGLKPAKPPAPEGQSKYMANATSNLDRLTASSWISLAPVIAEKIKPSALQAMRDAIDQRLAAGEAA